MAQFGEFRCCKCAVAPDGRPDHGVETHGTGDAIAKDLTNINHTGWCNSGVSSFFPPGLSPCPVVVPIPGCHTQANVSLRECTMTYARSLKLFGVCPQRVHPCCCPLGSSCPPFFSPPWEPLLRFGADLFLSFPPLFWGGRRTQSFQIESTADEALVNSGSIHGKSLSYVADDRLAAG